MNFSIHRIFHASVAILAVSSIAENTLADGEGTPEPNLIPIRLSGDDIVGPFITEALRNNPGLQAYEKRYQAARESILSSKAYPIRKFSSLTLSRRSKREPDRKGMFSFSSSPFHGSAN